MKKTVIIYGSSTGTCQNIAETIAAKLGIGTDNLFDASGIKAEKVNVRRGPSSDHPVAWVFNRKGMPVEIVAEFENWRRIRDSDGEEGWILQNMLTGKRTAVVAPWRQGQSMPLLVQANAQSGLVAKVGAGVVAEVEACTGDWCEITTNGYDGWIEQAMLWGVYPGETVD